MTFRSSVTAADVRPVDGQRLRLRRVEVAHRAVDLGGARRQRRGLATWVGAVSVTVYRPGHAWKFVAMVRNLGL